MKRAVRVCAALGAVVLTLAAGLAVASAQDASPPALTVRDVDATDRDAVTVTFGYAGDRNDLTELTVREEGLVVDASTAVPLTDTRAVGIVLAIDTSGSMQEGNLIGRVQEAAQAFVADKAPSDRIAIVTFDTDVEVVEELTTDADVLQEALSDLPLSSGQTLLYDGIHRAANLFEGADVQPNIVVFTDGADVGSEVSADVAEAAVTSAGAALFAMGTDNDGFRVIQRMAERTGGTSATADDGAGVAALFEDAQQTLQRQYVVQFASRAERGPVGLSLTVGSNSAEAEYVVGAAQSGTANLQPQVVQKPSGPAFFRTSGGLMLALALAAVAAAVAAFALGDVFAGKENQLQSTLQPYSEGFVAGGISDEYDEDDGGDGRGAQMATAPILQRAVKATGEFAERQGFLAKVEAQLERANLALRPAEAIFFYFVGVVILVALMLALTQNPMGTLIVAGIGALVPPAILSFLAGRRQKAFNSMLPDTLQLLASTLRAGYSLMQGVEAVSQETAEPMGRELRRVVTEARLGRPLEDSMSAVAERMDSPDFAWAVMAIRIQREVGGNLAELLVTVAETMTERERLRRDVNALTAEGRVSAIVLGILPVGLGIFIMGANPGYLDPLFDKTVGNIMLAFAAILMGFGFWWMKKTIEVEI